MKRTQRSYLDFEQPIADLEAKIEELRQMTGEGQVNLGEDVRRLQDKCNKLIKKTYGDLDPWQVSLLARHPQRPYTLDYVQRILTEVDELAGDRAFADDPAIVCGTGRLQNRPVAWIGQQKGRDTKEKIRRNFGMPRPEGYRKAMRVMKLAERFQLPVLTFIDTPGAYPGIGAEERGQSEAIARNLAVMSDLGVPVICTVIGEGGSGGALAIGVGDRVNMLEYSTYSVISPEGCASILWKNSDKAPEAAQILGITAPRLKQLNLIDQIIAEPLGGAQRDWDSAAELLQMTLIEQLDELDQIPRDTLLKQRYQKIMAYGVYGEA